MPHRLKTKTKPKNKPKKKQKKKPNCDISILFLPKHLADRQHFPAISNQSGINDTNMQIIFEALSGQKSLDPTEMSVFFHFFFFFLPLKRAEKRKTVCSTKRKKIC